MKSRPNDRFGIIITEGLQHPPQPHTIPSSCLRRAFVSGSENRAKAVTSQPVSVTKQPNRGPEKGKRRAKNNSECKPDYTCQEKYKLHENTLTVMPIITYSIRLH